jgi:ubiquinone/menaquinone biosynthesis C-methylase UbiE
MDPRDPERTRVVAAAYDRYAEQVARGGYRRRWTYIATKALADWALLDGLALEGRRILNVGCCEPLDELFLVRQVIGRWIGLDRNLAILAAGQDVLRNELAAPLAERITLCAGDAALLPFRDAAFDLVISFSALEHIPDSAQRTKALAEIARVTRPGAHVAITVPNRYSLFFFSHRRHMARETADYGYAHLYTPGEFRRCLERVGLRPLRFHSEIAGMAALPSYLPSGRLRSLLARLGYFGERIGFLTRREGPRGQEQA